MASGSGNPIEVHVMDPDNDGQRDDDRHLARRHRCEPWKRAALCYGAIGLAVLLFLLALRRSGERAGRLAERLRDGQF